MGAVNHAERTHALLSASGASRWLSCPPSARLEDMEPSSTSEAAEEGTLAHEIAESTLRLALKKITPKDHKDRLKELQKHRLYSDDMLEPIRVYTDYVLETYNTLRRTHKSVHIEIEARVSLEDYIPDGFGTCDVVIIADGVLIVIDLKFGQGVRVTAKGNKQLKIYALGAVERYRMSYQLEAVVTTIVQPRLDSVTVDEMTVNSLIMWGRTDLVKGAAIAHAGGGEQTPGDHCGFCRVAYKCRALHSMAQTQAAKEFVDPLTLSDTELLASYIAADKVTKWLKKVTDHVYTTALNGKTWEGLKLVEGRSNRVVSAPTELEERLIGAGVKRGDLYVEKMVGLGVMEKLVGVKAFVSIAGDTVTKPPGTPTLVSRETDERPEIGAASAASDFEGPY
jgi:hypothetical protein